MKSLRIAFLLVNLTLGVLSFGAPLYHLTNLGPIEYLGDGPVISVNDAGQITGTDIRPFIGERAFRYSAGVREDLGVLGGNPGNTYSISRGINGSGVVVGGSSVSGSYEGHAFMTGPSGLIDLNTVTGMTGTSGAVGINDRGDIALNGQGRGYLYSSGQLHSIGGIGGSSSGSITALNNQGQVVGAGPTAGNAETHAFRYEGGITEDLGTLGGSYSFAYDINDSGDVIGFSTINDSDFRAFIYNGGVMHDIGTLGGQHSFAYAINNSGQVVGRGETLTSLDEGFLYSDGTLYDLNNLLDSSGAGWSIAQPTDISNSGLIVGYGISNGQRNLILLTPVPETSTLMASALGLTLLTIRRKRRRLTVHQQRR